METAGVEHFEFAGGRFELPDPHVLLAGIGSSFEPVLQVDPAGTSPDGQPGVWILLATGTAAGQPVLNLRGRVTAAARATDGLHPAIVGAAYVAPLVAPLVDALSRLVGPVRGDDRSQRQSTVRDPGGSTLAATLTTGRISFDGSLTDTLDTTIDAASLTPDRLMAFVRIVFDAARRQAGRPADDAYLAGRSFSLGLDSAAGPAAAGAARAAGASGGGRRGSDDDVSAGVVRLDQIGGLDDVVAALRDVADSFKHPQAMARWGARRPQGILMWGPPGTGKTTLATALANEIGGTLREIRTPDILSKWVGQSEKNITRVFSQARAYRTPTVLLFDEFDSIIGYLGSPQGSADQVANSVAGIFKQEMNGLIDANPNVIVVATTNFPYRVDESLIRSGRFDVKISVPLPDAAGRADILAKMLSQLMARHEHGGFRMFGDLDVAELGRASTGLSGADLRELLRRVRMVKAMQEARGSTVTPITQADLLREITRLQHRE